MTHEKIMQPEIHIKPVGTIRNDTLNPSLLAGDNGLNRNESGISAIEGMSGDYDQVSEIILADDMTDLLDGIEAYSHLIVLYWGHQVPQSGRMLKKIHPAGLTRYAKQGIYATYSPARPNPVLMTVVRLLTKDKNRLYVSGLDAIHESPVLDIKPYVPSIFPQDDVIIPDWMSMIMKEFGR